MLPPMNPELFLSFMFSCVPHFPEVTDNADEKRENNKNNLILYINKREKLHINYFENIKMFIICNMRLNAAYK